MWSTLERTLHHPSVVFIVTDGIGVEQAPEFKALRRRHEIIVLELRDPIEEVEPPKGTYLVQDSETGELVWLDTGTKEFKEWFLNRPRFADGVPGVEHLTVRLGEDSVHELVRFFRERNRHRIRRA